MLLLWLGGVAVFVQRRGSRSEAQRITEAALRVAPQTYYYSVSQGGTQIGAAMSAIDTTLTSIIASDFFTGDYPVGPDTLRMSTHGDARYTRGLSLVELWVRAEGDLNPFRMTGTMRDSVIELVTISGTDTSRTRLEAPDALYTPTMVPVVGMLSRDRSVGDTITTRMFDPLSRTVKLVTLRVLSDSLFRLADSAVLDRASGRWSVAAHDTVRAWKLGGEGNQVTIWVDRQGRLVSASEPGGMTMLRGAFETSFVNWRNDRRARRTTGKRR